MSTLRSCYRTLNEKRELVRVCVFLPAVNLFLVLYSGQRRLHYVRVEYEELARAVHRAIAAKLSPALAEIVWGVLRGETPTEIAHGDLHS